MYFLTHVLPYWAGMVILPALFFYNESRRADEDRRARINELIRAVRRDRLS